MSGRYADNPREPACPTRVVLFGMRCAFTLPILTALTVAPDIALSAVVLPEPSRALPRISSDPIISTPRAAGSQILALGDRRGLDGQELRVALNALAPDIIAVACFPWRLPDWALSLPPRGSLNVHPSLLPDGRGPEPVFWAFRWALAETGVTLHFMDSGWDTGPILAQRRMPIPAVATMPALEQSLALLGADMLIEHLSPANQLAAVASPQPGGAARYARSPRRSDLIVDTSWSVHEATRFIRAVAPVYGAIDVLVLATGQRLAVEEVIGAKDEIYAGCSVLIDGDHASIRFADGTLVCRLPAIRRPVHLHRRT